MRKILLSTLYYLEVEADRHVFYKIGVTTRSISKRLEEIRRDLRSHFQTVAIKVLGTWAHRGNIEKYFKYRYSDFNYPIGSLTEYFEFVEPTDAEAVEHDLRSMKPKVLSPVEQDILDGKPSSIVQALYTKTKTLERSSQTQHQKQQAREANASINCSTDSELEQVFLSSPSSRRMIEALHQGCSLGHAAEIASGMAVN